MCKVLCIQKLFLSWFSFEARQAEIKSKEKVRVQQLQDLPYFPSSLQLHDYCCLNLSQEMDRKHHEVMETPSLFYW